jgi:hypothetical protein
MNIGWAYQAGMKGQQAGRHVSGSIQVDRDDRG